VLAVVGAIFTAVEMIRDSIVSASTQVSASNKTVALYKCWYYYYYYYYYYYFIFFIFLPQVVKIPGVKN